MLASKYFIKNTQTAALDVSYLHQTTPTLTFPKLSLKLANASKELLAEVPFPPLANGSLPPKGSALKSPKGSTLGLWGAGLLDLGGAGLGGGCFLFCLGGRAGVGEAAGFAGEEKGSLPNPSPPGVCKRRGEKRIRQDFFGAKKEINEKSKVVDFKSLTLAAYRFVKSERKKICLTAGVLL